MTAIPPEASTMNQGAVEVPDVPARVAESVETAVNSVRGLAGRVYSRARDLAGEALNMIDAPEDQYTGEVVASAEELVEIEKRLGFLFTRNEERPLQMQLDNPKQLTLESGAKVNIIHAVPENPRYDTSALIIPGWIASTTGSFEPAMKRLHESGRGVLAVDLKNRTRSETKEGNPNPKAIMRRVEATIAALDEQGIKEIDAVGHSMGAIVLALAATRRPDLFRNLVLVNPAGMVGEDNVFRLAKDFTLNTLDQMINSMPDGEERRRLMTAFVDGGKVVKGDPVNSIKEIFEISRTQIPDLLGKLKDEGHGITVIHSGGDIALPVGRVSSQTPRNVDGFIVTKGRHAEIYFDDRITDVVNFSLHNMEAKSSRAQIEKKEEGVSVLA